MRPHMECISTKRNRLLQVMLFPLVLANTFIINSSVHSSSSYSHHRSLLNVQLHSKSKHQQADDVNNNQPSKQLLVFGLGNIGSLVARRASTPSINGTAPFQRVYGTTRSGKTLENVETIQYDSYERLRDIVPNCTHILITIPPIDSEDARNNTYIGGRPRNWKYFCDPVLNNPKLRLAEIVRSNTWIGFVSSTSVYGNHDGNWVNEDSDIKCLPTSKGALYFRAETEWRESANSCGWRMNVFRCAGLYGDRRSALHTIRKRGASKTAFTKVSNPTSRIHEEDAAQAILSAMLLCNESDNSTSFSQYNLADDEPAPRNEVMVFGHELLDSSNLLPDHRLESPKRQPTERDQRRKTDNKRVDGKRMKDILLPEGLLYPTYREGLKAILETNRQKWS